jgi:hypothetical protein
MGRAPFLLLVKEKVAAKRPDEVYCSEQNESHPANAGKPHPSFATLTDTLSLTGRGDDVNRLFLR